MTLMRAATSRSCIDGMPGMRTIDWTCIRVGGIASLLVPLDDGPILEATDAESVPITAVHGRNEERRTRPDDLSIRASVEEVHRLVTQVVCTLSDPTCQQHPSSALQSARARALTLLDQLEKLIA